MDIRELPVASGGPYGITTGPDGPSFRRRYLLSVGFAPGITVAFVAAAPGPGPDDLGGLSLTATAAFHRPAAACHPAWPSGPWPWCAEGVRGQRSPRELMNRTGQPIGGG